MKPAGLHRPLAKSREKANILLDRYWLLTWTTYGSWLPGDDRGFVGEIRDPSGKKVTHNTPGTPYDFSAPALALFAHSQLKSPPVYLKRDQASALLLQFQETAEYRQWLLIAVAVMSNHAHVIVRVPGDPDPSDILRDFKSYGSRRLNDCWGKPSSGTWWTESGSKRKLPDEQSIRGAGEYVRHQPRPLIVWTREYGCELVNGI